MRQTKKCIWNTDYIFAGIHHLSFLFLHRCYYSTLFHLIKSAPLSTYLAQVSLYSHIRYLLLNFLTIYSNTNNVTISKICYSYYTQQNYYHYYYLLHHITSIPKPNFNNIKSTAANIPSTNKNLTSANSTTKAIATIANSPVTNSSISILFLIVLSIYASSTIYAMYVLQAYMISCQPCFLCSLKFHCHSNPQKLNLTSLPNNFLLYIEIANSCLKASHGFPSLQSFRH